MSPDTHLCVFLYCLWLLATSMWEWNPKKKKKKKNASSSMMNCVVVSVKPFHRHLICYLSFSLSVCIMWSVCVCVCCSANQCSADRSVLAAAPSLFNQQFCPWTCKWWVVSTQYRYTAVHVRNSSAPYILHVHKIINDAFLNTTPCSPEHTTFSEIYGIPGEIEILPV